jgi:hypothetical protein
LLRVQKATTKRVGGLFGSLDFSGTFARGVRFLSTTPLAKDQIEITYFFCSNPHTSSVGVAPDRFKGLWKD